MGCAVWRLLLATGRITPPRPIKGSRFAFGALTALMVGAVLVNFRTLNGLAAGTSLLVLMGALKLLESRTAAMMPSSSASPCSCCWPRRWPTNHWSVCRSIYCWCGWPALP